MRIKNFTLLTLALFVMSVVAFAQKPNSTNRVITPKRQLLQAKRTGELTKENVGAFKFAKPTLPQNMQKARANKPVTNFNVKKLDANAIAQAKAKKAAKKSSNNSKKGFRQIDARSGYPSLTSSAMRRSNRAAEIDEHGIITAPGEGTVKVYKVTGSGYNYGDFVNLDGATTKIVESTDGSVYIQDIVTTYSRGVWVKGTKSGNTITVPAKQPLYYSSQYDATVSARWSTVSGTSIVPADDTAENFTLTVDETAQTISLNGTNETLILSALWDDDDTWSGYSVWETVYTYDHDYVAPSFVTITPPAGLETTTWYTKGHTYSNGSTSGFKGTVSLGFDGNDVYVQGIFSDFPEAWVKGTIDGTTVTFKGLQVQGDYYGYTIYAVGTDGSELTDFVMTYDAEKGILTSENELLANAAEDRIYYLTYITDLEINKNAPVDSRVTPPAGLVTEDWTIARYFYDFDEEASEEKVIQIGFDGKDVYVQGFSHYSDYMEDENWIKGTLSEDGKSITFASNQYYGSYQDTYDFYFAAYDGDLAPSVTVDYDAEAGTITWPNDVLILENSVEDEVSIYGYFSEIAATVKGTAPDPLPAPDIVTTEWYFKSQSLSEDAETHELIAEDYNLNVQVGIAGNDVFVKGLCEDLPDTWIKGTLDPATNKVTFPTGQHFGTYLWYWKYEYYFAGYGANGFEDVVMAYDADAKTLTMDSNTFILINSCWLLLDPNLILADAQLSEIPDVAAVPAQPTITGSKFANTSYPYLKVDIPAFDEEGNPIMSSKLTYQYLCKVGDKVTPLTLTTDLYTELTEDMTEIPYGFSDGWDIYNDLFYLNMDFSGWDQIGIQSIYRGGDEENKSEIFWYDIYQPQNVELSLEPGSDISAYVAATETQMESQFYAPNITVNLAGGEYTVSAPLETMGNLKIIGKNATINASELEGPFIKLDGTRKMAQKADGTESDHRYIDSVYVSGVTITGLKDAFIKDNQKTLLNVLLVENSVIEMPASNKNFIDFNGKGYVGEVTVTESTIWAKNKNTGFFAQYGSRPKNVDGNLLQQFNVEKSTIVYIANGKNFCDLKQNGTAQNVYTLKDNIFVDCGKQNQVVVGFNKGQTSATPVWTVSGNSFIWNGESVNAAEIEKAGQKDGEDIVKNCVEGLPGFADAAAGDFTLDPTSKQAKHKTGDPRWLLEYYAAPGDLVDIDLTFTEGIDISVPFNEKVAEIEAQDKSVGNITIKLAFNSKNTITKPLVVTKGIKIFGENAVINASGLTQPMIQMSKVPVVEKVESGQYVITDPILIDNVVVNGLTKALFADNSKPYSYTNFTISNSLFQYDSQTVVALNLASSMAINLNILNSTFWSKTAGSANFIAMSGKRPWQTTGFENETGKFICANNTFYNMAKSKQFMNTNTLKGQIYKYEFNSNIFVNTSNQKIYGNMTNTSANQLTTDGKNTYLFGSLNYSDPGYVGEFFSETQYKVADVGLQFDPKFVDADNGDFTVFVGAKQQKYETGDPRWLTYFDPAFAEVEDVNLALTDGAEISSALENEIYKKGIDKVGAISITLEAGDYTIEKSIEAPNSFSLFGPVNLDLTGRATIDASKLDGPFVLMSKEPTLKTNEKGAFVDGSVSFMGVDINNLKQQLVYANKTQYLMDLVGVFDCVIGIDGTAKKTIFDFNGGGNTKQVSVLSSTIWANPTNGQNGGFFSSQSSKDVRELDETATQTFEIYSSTLYNITNGKTVNTLRKNSQEYQQYIVNRNIVVNCGKSNQFLKGLNAGQAGKDVNWQVDGNVFNFDGAISEEQQIGSSEDNIKNTIKVLVNFADAENGDFRQGGVESVGDPRWYDPSVPTAIENVMTNIEKYGDGAWYTVQGIRVDKPTKGVFIHNGKKVVIK